MEREVKNKGKLSKIQGLQHDQKGKRGATKVYLYFQHLEVLRQVTDYIRLEENHKVAVNRNKSADWQEIRNQQRMTAALRTREKIHCVLK